MQLFKIDSKGKVRTLIIKPSGTELVQLSGLLGGKLVENRKQCHPKNVGKVNETTASQQAAVEAEAKIARKLSEGYFSSVTEAQSNVVIKPMLAHSYEKYAKKVDWTGEVFAQPKLDGMRAIWVNGKLYSRTGKEITTVPHINEALKTTSMMLDGELYAHDYNFQENMRLIKKTRPETVDVHFHVYDCIASRSFKTRLQKLSQLPIFNGYGSQYIELVTTYELQSEIEMKELFQAFLNDGYEGLMLRHGKDKYKTGGRSQSLLKFKEFIDIAAEVIDVTPSEARPNQGIVVCVYNGVEFKASMKATHQEREELLSNKEKYIGQTAEIRFFEFSETNVPRFPVCVGFRLDK